MPSIKYRQGMKIGGGLTVTGSANVANLITASGLWREYNIPWQDWLSAASGVGNFPSASVSVAAPNASGPMGLLFAGASSGCFLNVAFRCPQDIAITGAAAGSGQLWSDWATTEANGAVATIAACVIFIPSGSGYVATGASQRLGSGCVNPVAASTNAINSSCLFQFNYPTNRNGMFMIRFAYCGQDNAQTTASSFYLYGVRVRYLSDRLGS